MRFALTSAVLALGIAATSFGIWGYQQDQSSTEMERSIGVLLFENLSPGSDEAFFAIGMQNEITAELARLVGTKVIGAESTGSYLSDKRRNYPAIGRELGANHLLEASVCRVNGETRVTLRPVDLGDSVHIWAETYERPSKDVFALPSEVVQAVAAQLQTRLSPRRDSGARY